jgi:L-aminopeptidase/D-esterase-like protein
VNAVGDVIDPADRQGDRRRPHRRRQGLADARLLLRSGATFTARPGENTTLGVVATNATLTKAQARKVAQMAHDGFARAISPIHTPADGDTIFTLAHGSRAGEPDILRIGALGGGRDERGDRPRRAQRQGVRRPAGRRAISAAAPRPEPGALTGHGH